jgi:hypothetical protein
MLGGLYLLLDQQASYAAACLVSGARPQRVIGGILWGESPPLPPYVQNEVAGGGKGAMLVHDTPIGHARAAVSQGVGTGFTTSPN